MKGLLFVSPRRAGGGVSVAGGARRPGTIPRQRPPADPARPPDNPQTDAKIRLGASSTSTRACPPTIRSVAPAATIPRRRGRITAPPTPASAAR